jgi:hypothetical protein
MKTINVISFLFLLLNFSNVKAQTYYPISDTNAVWDIVLYPDPQGPYPFPYVNHFKYRLDGDTLINSISYQKLLRTSFNIVCSVDSTTELYGFLRNDIEMRKVFYRDIYSADELLLYDFNLKVGDTLKGSVFLYLNPFTVSAIDSILINNNYHKRYSINLREFFMDEYLIEGVGTTVGLLERVSEFWPFYELRCFSQNGQLGYLSPRVTDCRLESDTCYVGIYDQLVLPKIRIFPNPAKDYLYLNLDEQTNINNLFTLYDITGRVLYQKEFISSLMLDCSTYERGIVFYRISSIANQQGIGGKIILQ